jgi:hypothetical protein
MNFAENLYENIVYHSFCCTVIIISNNSRLSYLGKNSFCYFYIFNQQIGYIWAWILKTFAVSTLLCSKKLEQPDETTIHFSTCRFLIAKAFGPQHLTHLCSSVFD